ncbi:hypothetical protein [Fibrella forsythiae]|uniref:O-antigen ligase domain-containing protein n=1 Tax=Fibrella forsythiae TaxID=2817061 RepID=A0ABS3JSQ3_9BACT|nr:hypothetical protein [Fibrella forsythiae]MBO0952411.1 hypothetical protein [Fibrella forsythiae]
MGKFMHKWAMIRLCVGIMMVLDGYPLIFFIKETLQVAPGSANFTAGFLLLGMALMIPSTALKKYYTPNMPVLNALVGFIVMSIIYSFMFNEVAIGDRGRDLIFYFFVLLFLFLLVNVPNEITEQIVIVAVLFTLVSNIGLVYSLITDPDWHLGQRAAIQFGMPGEKSGNPHVFSRNAQIGLLACLMWANRAKQSFIIKIIGISLAIFNIIILMLTFSKSAILSTTLLAVMHLVIQARTMTPKQVFRIIFSPLSLIVAAMPFVGFFVLIILKPEIWDIIYLYGDMIFGRFSENILALLGAETAKGDLAELDGSSVNRVMSWTYTTYAVIGNPLGLIMGYGYKFFFLDIPVLEALINQGLFGFLMYGHVIYQLGKESLKVAYKGGHTDIETFAAYLFLFGLVGQFTGGRPYEMAVLHPLCFYLRFLGVYYAPELSRGYVAQPTPLPVEAAVPA